MYRRKLLFGAAVAAAVVPFVLASRAKAAALQTLREGDVNGLFCHARVGGYAAAGSANTAAAHCRSLQAGCTRYVRPPVVKGKTFNAQHLTLNIEGKKCGGAMRRDADIQVPNHSGR